MTNTEQTKTGTLAQEGQEQEAQVTRRINQGTVGAGVRVPFQRAGAGQSPGRQEEGDPHLFCPGLLIILFYYFIHRAGKRENNGVIHTVKRNNSELNKFTLIRGKHFKIDCFSTP